MFAGHIVALGLGGGGGGVDSIHLLELGEVVAEVGAELLAWPPEVVEECVGLGLGGVAHDADLVGRAFEADGVLALAEHILGKARRQREVADMAAIPLVVFLVSQEGAAHFLDGAFERGEVADLDVDVCYMAHRSFKF